MFGLLESDVAEILTVLVQYPEVDEALIFGSRAMGNFREGSDVDIALKGQDLPYSIVSAISGILNEDTTMPYHFDVVNYHSLSNPDLMEHIDRVGKVIYEKVSSPSVLDPGTKYPERPS